MYAIVISIPILVNNRPWYFGRPYKKDKRRYLNAPICDIIYLYRDTVRFDASLFYIIMNGST